MTKIPKFIVFYQTAEMGEIVKSFLEIKGYSWNLEKGPDFYIEVGVGNFSYGESSGSKKIGYQNYLSTYPSYYSSIDGIFNAETDFGKMVKFFSKREYKEIVLNETFYARVFEKTTEIWEFGKDKNYYALINNVRILDLQPLIDKNSFDWKKVSIACSTKEEKAAAAKLLSKFCDVQVGICVSTFVAYAETHNLITGFGTPPDEYTTFQFFEIPKLLLDAEKQFSNVKLTDGLVAEKDQHGIKVGCQTFRKEKIEELINLIKG